MRRMASVDGVGPETNRSLVILFSSGVTANLSDPGESRTTRLFAFLDHSPSTVPHTIARARFSAAWDERGPVAQQDRAGCNSHNPGAGVDPEAQGRTVETGSCQEFLLAGVASELSFFPLMGLGGRSGGNKNNLTYRNDMKTQEKKVQHAKELSIITAAAAFFAPPGSFIAGGALTSAFTGQPINDVDMYFKTKSDFIEAVEMAYDDGMWCLAATDRAVTFASRDSIVQLMHFDYFKTAEEIFDAFDFTVCMAAYDQDEKQFIFHEDFMKHAAQRFLRFHSGTRYPFGSLMRVLKYQKRGYTIGASDMLRIGLCTQRVELNLWDDLAAAIGGQYGEKAKIDTDTPFSIDAALELFKDSEVMVPDAGEAMPGDADELLERIGVLRDGDKELNYERG